MDIDIYDLESYNGLFLFLCYTPDNKIWKQFQISEYQNDLYALIKHLHGRRAEDCFDVSFNGIAYDGQVLQYILDNYERWIDLGNTEIIKLIKRFSNKLIDDGKYGLRTPYFEDQIEIKQIDLFKIHHYDNKNRATSLKWLQFSMDFHTVEESPIPFTQERFTLEEIEECIHYCKNDIESTYQFYLFTIGQTNHEDYKGRNKIQDRLDLIEEFQFPLQALSWSDVTIGDKINKKVYKELTRSTDKDIYLARRARKPTPRFTFGDCLPEHIKFKTATFQQFYDRMKSVRVNLMEKEKFPFTFNKTTYVIAKGGIHSNERNRITIPTNNEILRDADVGSQYPHAIIKRGLYPSHLSKLWLVGYTGNRNKRITYKDGIELLPEGDDKRRKLKGLSEMLKLAINGGFGKTKEQTNWQYDPVVTFKCTIGNQFEILMLIEMMEMRGIHCISANTDGIVCLFDKSLDKVYYEVAHEWERIVGNDKQGKLEFVDYRKLIQTTVNDYIAIKANGKTKKKGDFLTYTELHKNKSKIVIAKAYEKYFTEGIPVAKTIIDHKNIFDFCIGVKSSRDYHYETISKTGESTIYDRMIRYYVSNSGNKLIKVKNDGSEADGNDITNCEAGGWKCTIANNIDENIPIEKYNINYKYYIDKAEEVISDLERSIQKKGKRPPNNPNQTSMF